MIKLVNILKEINKGNSKLIRENQYFHNGAEMNQIINYDDSNIADDLEALGQGSMDGQDFRVGGTYNIGGKEYKVEAQGDEFKLVLAEVLNEAKKAKETFEEFATKRLAGAEKIADTTQEAGGLSLLTYRHYKVKLPYYKKATAGKLDKEAAKKEFNETLKNISLNMTQNEFQTEVGRLEVLGELLIREN